MAENWTNLAECLKKSCFLQNLYNLFFATLLTARAVHSRSIHVLMSVFMYFCLLPPWQEVTKLLINQLQTTEIIYIYYQLNKDTWPLLHNLFFLLLLLLLISTSIDGRFFLPAMKLFIYIAANEYNTWAPLYYNINTHML